MTARTPRWRKSSRSMANGNCVEVAVEAACVRGGCDEAATTVRDEVELCAFCTYEHDWYAEQHPIALTAVSTAGPPVNGICPFCNGSGCSKCDDGTIWVAL